MITPTQKHVQSNVPSIDNNTITTIKQVKNAIHQYNHTIGFKCNEDLRNSMILLCIS